METNDATNHAFADKCCCWIEEIIKRNVGVFHLLHVHTYANARDALILRALTIAVRSSLAAGGSRPLIKRLSICGGQKCADLILRHSAFLE